MKKQESIKVKPNYKRKARYTDEEKYKIFVEGLGKVPTAHPTKKGKMRKAEKKYKGVYE